MLVECGYAEQRIDRGNHAIERVDADKIALRHQRMQYRRGVGQTAGFDHHAIERRNRALHAPRRKLGERLREIATHVATQATVGKLHKTFLAGLDQIMIQPNRAEFIDDDRGAAHRRIANEACEQRGLAAAEKAGEDGNGDHGGPGAATTRTALPRSTPSASRTAVSKPTSEPHARGRNSRTPPGASPAARQRTNQRNGVSSAARSTHATAPLAARISAITGSSPECTVPATCHSARLSSRKARSRAASVVSGGPLTTSRRF